MDDSHSEGQAGSDSCVHHAVQAVAPGGTLVAIQELSGGSSATMLALDITMSDGSTNRLVFRQHDPASFKGSRDSVAATEFLLLQVLHQNGFQVPRPLLNHRGGSVRPYLVTEWIPGSTDVPQSQLLDALQQMGGFLARLHGLDLSRLQGVGLEPIEDPWITIRSYLPQDPLGDAVRQALTGSPAPPVSNPIVLLHGDYWPGNILWRSGKLVAVIDWEDAAVGDPLADLATARLELVCAYGVWAANVFTAAYVKGLRTSGFELSMDDYFLWAMHTSAAALASMHRWGLDPVVELKRRTQTEAFLVQAARNFLSEHADR